MIATDTLLQSRYRIGGLIDRGGMADVYRARDVRLERDVAVKVLREVEHEPRFATEARTLARLHHPNLVRLLDAGTDKGDAFLVLELLDGATLRELLADGPLPPPKVARIGAETTAALDYIHRQGIVHRDVKPSNLMLDDYGSIRLADFGIARLLGGTRVTATHQTIGTMAYIAPEQLEGGEIGPHTDIYSLGLVLIESLTGRRVFAGPPAEAAAARLSRDPAVPADLPGPWSAVLRAMTARDPAQRPDASDVHDRLGDDRTETAPAVTAPIVDAGLVAGDATAPVRPARTDVVPSSARDPRRGQRRRPWAKAALAAALLTCALVAGVVAYGATSGSGSSPPNTTTAVPTTVAPATTLPPQTAPLPPLTVQPDNRGNDKGRGKGAAEDFQRWLEQLRRLLGQQTNQGD